MKKLLLSVFALAIFSAANAQCNELFISEYVEGTSYDKAIEIYNPTNNPVNLSGYIVARFGNGSSTWVNTSTGGIDTTQLRGIIGAHDVWVLTNNNASPATSPALIALADQLDHIYTAPTYMNGNDAIVLYKGTTIIDIFGKTGDAAMIPSTANGWSAIAPYDGSPGTGVIWTQDHTLVRKPTVTQGVTVNPSPEFIVTAQWDSLPVNTFTGLGSHSCSCLTGIDEIDNTIPVSVYPNPNNSGLVHLSTSISILSVSIFNTLGQEVIVKNGNKNDKSMTIETSELSKGVYFVKVGFENEKTTIVKLSIQ